MARPRLSVAITWERLESEILDVFREALTRLAARADLPQTEEPINLELYWLARTVHHEYMQAVRVRMPFSILFDSTSQPEPDDQARAARLRKRPDFNCVITNPQAESHLASQVNYYLECKRLGQAAPGWVLNDNYSQHGITRFIHNDWQYAKGCRSGTMVGYVQNMEPADVLAEVNSGSAGRGLPPLVLPASGWVACGVTPLTQGQLTRTFQPAAFTLGHLWVDVRPRPASGAASAPPPAPPATKAKAPRAKSKTKAPRKQAKKKMN